MRGLSQHIMSMSPEQRQRAIDEAGAAIASGGAVVLPTDTLYGVFVGASAQGAELLDERTGHPQPDDEPRFTLHAADPAPVAPLLDRSSPVVRRLFSRLLPGPTRVVLDQPEAALAAVCAGLGIPRGLVENGSMLALRVPDHPVARAVIRASGGPTLARGLGASVWGVKGNPGIDASLELGGREHEPEAVIDDGPTLHRSGSTTVHIALAGGFTVRPGGPLKEDEVLSMLNTRVLFVCTGNTCRSAMAAAIARSLVRRLPPSGISVSVDSAGVAAGEGHGAAAHAIEALRERKIELSKHRSRALTPEMIDASDLILTMTPSHAQAVMQMAPGAVHKVFPLDELHPIEDPIGRDVAVYRDVADRLARLIQTRLEEIIQ